MIHSLRLIFASCVVLAGCTVGEVPSIGVGGPDGSVAGADAPGHEAQDAARTAALDGGTGPTADASACKNKVANPLTDGHHNPGMDCQDACHNHGFTLSGTLYTSAAGTTPLSGGTITVTDSTGASVDLVTATNGNFYTSNAVKFPITVVASACPAITPMTEAITTGNGGCNKAGCHGGSQGPIHLP